MENTTNGESVGLAAAIAQVRAELVAAQSAGADEKLKFRLGEVKLDFEVAIAREGGVEAGVKVWVVNVGAKGTVSSSKTHTVTVTMIPQILSAAGQWEDARVGGEVLSRPLTGSGGH